MRILWISYFGSWTKPLAEQIAKDNTVCVIIPSSEDKKVEENNVCYNFIKYSLREAKRVMTEESFRKFKPIIESFKPDIIHAHGTENNLAQVQEFLPKTPVVVSIQGVINGCFPYTKAYVNCSQVYRFKTLKNVLGLGGLNQMERTCKKAAAAELRILENNKYFFGRTDFDKAHILMRNPTAHYFVGEELLRSEFYANAGTWNLDSCERHSIFMPSGFNPIKGMHLAIKTVALLKGFYPDIKLYIPGVLTSDSQKKRLLSPIIGEEYIRYSFSLVEQYDLKENVIFMSRQTAQQMAEHMKKAHVFLAPSSIDNSPNAVGEATMIGCPVVTTPVGGIPSFLKDHVHALLSPAGDPYMLAYYIKQIFDDDALASSLSRNAHELALRRHDIYTVTQQYIDVYKKTIELHKTSKK